MNAAGNRTVAWVSSLMMLAGIACFAALDNVLFLLPAPALLLVVYLLQHPHRLFYLLLAAIPWSIEFSFNSGLGTDLPDEPLMLLTALSVIMMAVWQRRQLTTQKIHPLLLILLLQFAWTICTVLVSTDPLQSFKYLLAKSWYLLAFVAAPLLLLRREKELKRGVLVLLGSMLVFMFVALVRHAGNGWTFEKINDSLQPFYRNHVNYSALLVFMVPLQVAVIQLSVSRRWRVIMRCTLAITVTALYFSYARGAWLALLTGVAAYWIIRKKLFLPSLILFFSLCIGALFWLKSNDHYIRFAGDYKSTIFHTDFREHLIATYQLKDMSNAERFYRWVAGVRMLPDSWRTGFGPSSFYHHYKPYAVPAFRTWVSANEEQSTVHNYFLLTIIEQGVIGLLLLLALLGGVFWYVQSVYHRTDSRFWKVVTAAAGAIMTMECTVNFLSDLVETDKIGSIFYLCIAVVIMADQATRNSLKFKV